MFKLLLPAICIAMCVIYSSAYPHPEERYSDVIPDANVAYVHSIQERAVSSAQTQSNTVSGDDDSSNESDNGDDESSDDANEDQPAQQSNAPAGVTRLSPISRSYALVSSTRGVPAIQHHILPAQSIPLPITISTRPGVRTILAPETITIHEPTIAKVGEVVQKIPTAVSHQSQTIVHKHARVVTPIVAPAVRTITSQVVRAYHTPLVYAPHAPNVRVVAY